MKIPLLTEAGEKLSDADVMGAIFTALENSAGSFVLVATLMAVPTMIGLWAWTGTLLAPAIVLALFGGIMIPNVTAAPATVGALIVAVGVVVALLAVWRDT